MAFTDVQVQQAIEAVKKPAVSARDLYRLGLIYSTGQGCDVDVVAAHKWFNLAAVKGISAARESRNDIAGTMTRDQLVKAQREAREWLNLH
jgi:uncharacterized protein